VRCKVYPTPYKMQEIVDKEVDDLLEMGVIERPKAPYASPLVLVKKADNTCRMCVNFKELNKITVFDPEPMMSPDYIFLKLAGSKIYVDDVLGHTENSSKRMEILRDFFERVKRANMCLRPSKCKVGFDQVKFLGHTLQ